MDMPKEDPRVQRTRKLIQDAFMFYMKNKDFNDITVRDITAKATVNRATFYAHFADKYQLMDDTLTDVLWEKLQKKLQCHDGYGRETIEKILVIMCGFHEEVSDLFKRNYATLGPHIESRINEELQQFFLSMMLRSRVEDGPPPLELATQRERLAAITLSRGVYGMSYGWNKEGRKSTPEAFAAIAMQALEDIGLLFPAKAATS